jgi:hypothetical protein
MNTQAVLLDRAADDTAVTGVAAVGAIVGLACRRRNVAPCSPPTRPTRPGTAAESRWPRQRRW